MREIKEIMLNILEIYDDMQNDILLKIGLNSLMCEY